LSHPDQTNQLLDDYFTALSSSGLFTGQYSKYLAASSVQELQTDSLPLLVYTAMHGVGFQCAQRVFQSFHLPAFASVPQQQEPDPTFPTVPSPNPEERHALDLAKEYGLQQLQATSKQGSLRNIVILANDPDADRLAVAEYNVQDQTWTTLTGDQIGILLGHWLWTQIGKSSDKVSRRRNEPMEPTLEWKHSRKTCTYFLASLFMFVVV
jgi:phosphomannomutase